MQISYNKLWKTLIDHGMSAAELRKKADFAPNTLTKLKQNQPVALTLLLKICEILETDIDSVVSFVPETKMSEEERKENILEFSNISKALSSDFVFVYHVNLETDEFVEYRSDTENPSGEMKPNRSGKHFFEECAADILKIVYPDDQKIAKDFFNKENLVVGLQSNPILSATYRVKFGFEDDYAYYRTKVILTPFGGIRYLVIGVSDIDTSIKKEMQQASALNRALKMANRDPLTSVGNVNAFMETEKIYNTKISNNDINNFSIVFCDVNDLKIRNDTQGHAAGDALIKYVSSTICSVFKQSPVFRIGGDEFVVFLSGNDFDNREELFKKIRLLNKKNAIEGKDVFSCGMATFNPETDFNVSSVLERADSMMYYNKRELKVIQQNGTK